MAYTHDWEIKINGVVVEGEIDFDKNKIKTIIGEELTVAQHGAIQQFLEMFIRTAGMCRDQITKIELVKKGYEG